MKKKLISIIASVIVLGMVGFYFVNANKKLEVSTAEVVEGTIEQYVEELGAVKATNQASIYSFVSGRVEEVLVRVGDSVSKGDVLVRIDPQQQERQLAELQAMKVDLEAQYREALKPLDSNEIKKLELDILDMERRLKESEANAINAGELYKSGAISNYDYKAIMLNLETERTLLAKAKIELEQVKKPLSQNIALQYEAKLKQLNIQQEEIESRSGDFNITSPINGVVMMKAIDKGSFIQPGMLILEVGDTVELYIESDVLVADIAEVEEGALVRVSNKDLKINDVKGKVKKIHPQAFSKISDLGIEQKRIKVEIDIIDPVPSLKPGYDLDLKIVTAKKEKVILIPEGAIFQQAGKAFVFVEDNGTAKLREIQLGLESEKKVEIVSGLSVGDKIILWPDEKLTEGASVKIRK